ncbi:uncharacterized protein THITE_2115997 [Thermothielavioides terrestris NRRL 8126]|uniref:O-methyltransferase C-terminal domain-containing protein n=1 Tax=Thermothielavioides terrestris (strain ATCC 38088 / NRRL 8126) TaxID=578455 RepID=G2QZE1_THETT|nr:uncharacterized protein THITE_2115997 [Thermothielavioides terrestris NRRL 8126]AEO67174.1 hypothetical protein THITE_2115997 [Thermothielavioides terrestris NRRL 8126]
MAAPFTNCFGSQDRSIGPDPCSNLDAVDTLKKIQGIINSYLASASADGRSAIPTPQLSPVPKFREDGKGKLNPEDLAGGLAEAVREDADRTGRWAARDSITSEKMVVASSPQLSINATQTTDSRHHSPQAHLAMSTNRNSGAEASDKGTDTELTGSKMEPDGPADQVPKGSSSSNPGSAHGSEAKPTSPLNTGLGLDRIRRLVDEVSLKISQATSEDAARVVAATGAAEIADAVRPPGDTILGWFANMSVISAVRLFLCWGAFDLIPAGSEASITYADLARRINADEGLVVRVASMLTSSHVLVHHPPSETQPVPSLSHTPVSLMLLSGQPMSAMFSVMYKHINAVSTILPSYFDTYGRTEPVGPAHIPTSYLAGHPEEDYFSLLKKDEAAMKNFNLAMRITSRRVPVTGMYDMSNVLRAASEGRETVWVDVGGGDGHTVKEFLRAYPGLKAEQCVVQDLEEVVAAAQQQDEEELRGVRWVALDFLKEAPVQGALVYYLRHILRDYSDPVAVRILANVARALTDPAARVLVSEQLNPDWARAPRPPPLYAAFKDFSMLSIGGKERSLPQFAAVADAAGLAVSAVFRDDATPHAVVELALKGVVEGAEC